jgi:ribosomal protein L21E
MRRFTTGDRVRIDIPNESDPDHEPYHGARGTVAEVLQDDAGLETSDERDNHLFRVSLEDGGTVDMRWRDLRPAETPDHN